MRGHNREGRREDFLEYIRGEMRLTIGECMENIRDAMTDAHSQLVMLRLLCIAEEFDDYEVRFLDDVIEILANALKN